VWVAGTCMMIEQGTDGFSCDDLENVVATGADMLTYVPLNETAFEWQPNLEAWIQSSLLAPGQLWMLIGGMTKECMRDSSFGRQQILHLISCVKQNTSGRKDLTCSLFVLLYHPRLEAQAGEDSRTGCLLFLWDPVCGQKNSMKL
jgi:hypothetical protein